MSFTKLSLAAVGMAAIATAQSVGQGIDACGTVAELTDSCASAQPGFVNLSDAQQASCLCYGWIDNINAYQPKIFDEAFSQCNKFAATAAASAYSSALRSEGVQATQLPSSFCSSVGNVARATVTDTYGLSDYVSATYSSGSVTPARTVSSARATSTAAQGPGATSRPATTPARTTPGSTPARSPTGPSARYTGAAANIGANAGMVLGLVGAVAAL